MALGAGTSFSANADDQRAFALTRVATAVINRIGLSQAMDMSCLSAVEALDADHSALVLFEDDGQTGTVVAEHGTQIVTKGLRVPLDSPLEQELMRDGQTIQIDDVTKCLELGAARNILTGLGIRSILIVPILVGGRVVGSLGVDRVERRPFTDEDERLCRYVASFIAIALERPEQRQPRPVLDLNTELQARLRAATIELVTPITRRKTLECIVQQAVDLVEASDGGLYLYEPGERQLRLVAVHGRNGAGRRPDTVLKIGDGMAGYLISSGAPHVVTSDDSQLENRFRTPGATPPFAAVLGVPMPGRENPRGVIFVESVRGRIYTADEIQAMRWFAEYASVWLEYAEQFEWQKRGLQLVQQTTCALTRATDLESGLQELAELIVSRLKHTSCRIFLADEDQKWLTPVAYAVLERTTPLVVSPTRWEQPLRAAGTQGALTMEEARQFHCWSDRRHRAALEELSKRLGLDRPLKSLLRVPLAIGERLVGLIEIGEIRDEIRVPMTEAMQETMDALAEQVAALIDRARQQNRVQRVARLLGDLEKFSASLGEITEEEKLPPEYLRLSTVLFPGTIGALFHYNRSVQALELMRTYPASEPAAVWSAPLDHSVLSQAVMKDMTCSVTGAEAESTARHVFGDRAIDWLVATPLRMHWGVEYVLLLGDPTGTWLREEPDLAILERLTARAASALANSRLINTEPSLAASMNRLQHIGQYMHLAQTLDALLQICLTGVTANYGLRFNRAAVFLLNDDATRLEGRGAVGDHHTWGSQAEGLDGFPQFIHALELGQLPPSTLQEAFTGLQVPIDGDDVFSRAIRNRQLDLIDPSRFAELPGAVQEAFAPVHQVIVVPMLAGDEEQGLLLADNAFTGTAISELDMLALLNYARTAAFAIQDRRNKDHALAGERLRRLYKASATLRILDEPRTVAEDFVNRLIDAAGAAGVSATFMDERNKMRARFTAGATALNNHPVAFRETGLSFQVLKSGAPKFISDTWSEPAALNPAMDLKQVRACACLPLLLPGGPIGVVWLTYDAPRSFSNEERDALAHYAEQAALAYRGAERFTVAGDMYELLHDHPDHADPRRAMQRLVGLAKQKFVGACSATIWPYDAEIDRFIPQDLVSVGIPEPELSVFREVEPGEDHTTFTALKEGYLEVADVDGERYQFILPEIRTLLQSVGIRSFQAVTLRAGDDPLGVLYVSYPTPRAFPAHERETLHTFAKSAAQALSHVRLLSRNQRARKAARAVAKITALGDKRQMLKRVAKHTKKVMRCGAVVVLAYNQTSNRFTYPYTMVGVRNRTWAGIAENFPRESWVTSKLSLTEPEVIDRADEHPEYMHRRFARDESIKTLVIVPLRASERVVGLMFLNFREHHRFTKEMSDDLNLFADQAAIAIHNTQLFEERAALDAFSQELLRCATVKEILNAASKEAARAFSASHTCVLKADEMDGHYYVSSFEGWNAEDMAGVRLNTNDNSQLTYTLKTRKTVMEDDLEHARDFVPHALVHREGLKSGISTCLHHEGEPIGAIIVHTLERRKFTDHERELIENIAAQTAIAMQGVSKFEGAVKRQSIHDLAITEAARAIAAADRDGESSMLMKILSQAAHIIGKPTVICTMHRVVREGADTILILDGVYPATEHEALLSKIGKRRSLSDGRIGVVGRAAQSGNTQRVRDINDDEDYVCFDERTLSELAVPLHDAELGEVAGVINIESAEIGAFTVQHERALKALVEVAVIALQKARTSTLLTNTVRDLRNTAKTLAGRKTLAWIGMLTNQWRHDIGNSTIALGKELENLEDLLRDFLGGGPVPPLVGEKISTIRSILAEVHDVPITPPLSSEEGVAWVRVNELLRERASQLNLGDARVTLAYQLAVDDDAKVFVSREWLRRAFDIVIDNAVKELMHVSPARRLLTLSTRKTLRGLEIEFKDCGRGFDPKARERVFTDRIPKSHGEHGLGYGLLMAIAIVETYGGHIEVAETGKEGTRMIIWFPQSTEA